MNQKLFHNMLRLFNSKVANLTSELYEEKPNWDAVLLLVESLAEDAHVLQDLFELCPREEPTKENTIDMGFAYWNFPGIYNYEDKD